MLVTSPFAAARHRITRATSLLGVICMLVAVVTALAGPASAEPVEPAVAPGAARATSVPVSSLAMTGTSTKVTVRRVYRKGQVQWISHILNTRLIGLDQCQAERSRVNWTSSTYRATVHAVCVDGPARTEAAVRQLVADRPWYRMQVTRVPLVGFSLAADLPSGNDRAVPAALAHLPEGDFTFAEGDDLSLSYVGRGVTQAQLDAAVAAFAAALGIGADKVEVTPLAG